ncbi:uncharacterized protein HMPREF1541_07569 [Cyphellophora europaea CBS 101466]|uniref:BZIP domain-containing protein n=1 Tax=Cyphellophora europaea (strain CBS 101466) TaxID=1220924 RepID=W2RN75_CYPE1|nr:uncharacterized protein HMPREF1541_07569 [Cyphellophora europaea CBS 101466]ETN37946.1 hypothetical protein HMPREF1541_07569 [Cyphellophora europaea CBS 101466]
MIQAHAIVRPGADSPHDDWSGITDPTLRRKLQNRCNQRAARRRRKAHHAAATVGGAGAGAGGGGQKTAAEGGGRLLGDEGGLHRHVALSEGQWRAPPDVDGALSFVRRAAVAVKWMPPVTTATANGSDHDEKERQEAPSTFASIRAASNCRAHVLSYITAIQAHASPATLAKKLYPMPADHLLTLIYYNVYRALIQNIAILGLDLDLMNRDDYPSPFLPMSPSASSAIAALPPEMMPTRVQKTVAHHPQWDIFPDPQVRDNIITYPQELIDDTELCLEMVGSQSRLRSESSDEAGCYVWGEPWQIDSWEVTERFVRKYYWLFAGSTGFERSTNRWRRQRGVPELDFAKLIEDAELSSPSNDSLPSAGSSVDAYS